MGVFSDRPAFLYAAAALLGAYIVLTLVSASSLPLEMRQVQSVAYLKHIGLVILNICFLFSRNRALNYLAFGVLVILPFDTYAEIYVLASSGSTTLWSIVSSVDGVRVVLWLVAVLALASKLLLDRYSVRDVSGG